VQSNLLFFLHIPLLGTMFRPDWPSSGVQVVMVKDSAAGCNTVFFPPIVVVSRYFGYVGYHQFYLDVLMLLVVALL
jgi:hypothetical protein